MDLPSWNNNKMPLSGSASATSVSVTKPISKWKRGELDKTINVHMEHIRIEKLLDTLIEEVGKLPEYEQCYQLPDDVRSLQCFKSVKKSDVIKLLESKKG